MRPSFLIQKADIYSAQSSIESPREDLVTPLAETHSPQVKELFDNIDKLFNEPTSPQKILQLFDTNGQVHLDDENLHTKKNFTKEQIKQRMAEDDAKQILKTARDKILWSRFKKQQQELKNSESTKHLRSPFESQIDLYVDADQKQLENLLAIDDNELKSANEIDNDILLRLIKDHETPSFGELEATRQKMFDAKDSLDDYEQKLYRLKENLNYINQTYRKNHMDVQLASCSDKLWGLDIKFADYNRQRKQTLLTAAQTTLSNGQALGRNRKKGSQLEFQSLLSEVQPVKDDLQIFKMHEELRKKKMRKFLSNMNLKKI